MADHGKNKRRSHFARKRQRKGKFKTMNHKKAHRKALVAWLLYWQGGPHPEAQAVSEVAGE